MSDPRTMPLPGHALCKWPNGVRWTGAKYVVHGPARGFGCECGVDFTTDNPYGEHEMHLYAVTSTLQRRRWTEVAIQRYAVAPKGKQP